jgi:hypothetical protein
MADKKNPGRPNVIVQPTIVFDDPETERYIRDKQERIWKRIEKAKQPPTHSPAREVSPDGIPLISIGVSTTGIDNEFNFRRVERKRDFEDSLSYMLSGLNNAIRSNKTLSTDQRNHLKRTRDAFEESIGQLEKRVYASGPEDGLDLIEAAISAAYEIGAFVGRHPIEGKLRTTKGRGVISAKVLRRREIITPLVLAEAKHKRKGIPERAFEKAKKLLRAEGLVKKGKNGKDGFSPRTFAEDVSQILADNPE